MLRDDADAHETVDRRSMLRVLGAGGLTGLAGCTGGILSELQGAPDRRHELVATLSTDVQHYDPTNINDSTSAKVFGLVYEALTATDFEGTPRPQLASSLEQVAERTFRATLREGVTFHNGDALAAADVKHSFERYKGTPREADVFDWYAGSDVVDERTIDIHLTRPYAPFRFALSGVLIVPSAVADGGLDLTDTPVGTGPYTLDQHDPDTLVRLRRYDDHWFPGSDAVPDRPPIETVTFRIIESPSSQLAALEAGDVDFISEPPEASIRDLEADERFAVTERVEGGVEMLVYPLHSDVDAPFLNRSVRRGVTRLIPREAIIETVYDGIGVPAYAPISPLAGAFTSEAFQREIRDDYAGFDPEKAHELLEVGFAEAGFEPPFETSIITNRNEQRVRWAQLVKERLVDSGFFEVTVEPYEHTTFVDRVLSEGGHAQNRLVALNWSAAWDADVYVNKLLHSEAGSPNCCNLNHYENERVDRLIDRGVETFDLDERRDIYRELQRLVAEDAPMGFVRFGTEFDAMWADTVKNFRTYPFNSGEYNGIYAPYADTYTRVEK